MNEVHERFLNGGDSVAVIAEDFGQSRLSDFLELRFRETNERVRVLVPEAVARLQLVELAADDAGEGGAHQAPQEGPLGHAAGEEVDIVNVVVDSLEGSDQVFRNLSAQVLKRIGPRQIAQLSVVVVATDSVLASFKTTKKRGK